MLILTADSKIFDLSGFAPAQVDNICKILLELPLEKGTKLSIQGRQLTVILPKHVSRRQQIKEILDHDFYYNDYRGTLREVLVYFMLAAVNEHTRTGKLTKLLAGSVNAYITNNKSLVEELMFLMFFFGFVGASFEESIRSSSTSELYTFYNVTLGMVEPYILAKMVYPYDYIREMLVNA